MKTLCFTPSQPVRLYQGEVSKRKKEWQKEVGVEVKRNKVDKK